jgi:hypothetical protein
MQRLEFRDGERDVVDHLAVLMAGMETHTMTYEQAVRATERKLLRDRLNEAQRKLVAGHMREYR